MCVLNRFSRVQFLVTPGLYTHQAPPSVALSRQEYWSMLPCPRPKDLPIPKMEPAPLTSPTLAASFSTSITQGTP